jgi:hypothetical protein
VACWSQDQADRADQTDASKDWKFFRRFFQGLELFAATFSGPWKRAADFFRALENRMGGRGFLSHGAAHQA